MIPRYSRPEMVAIWSPETKFRIWFEIEAHAADAMAELGIIPKDAARKIWDKGRTAKFDVARIDAIEREVQHDVIAFVSNVAENVGPEGRWLHYGLTSSDVVDTALALLMRDATDLIRQGVEALRQVVGARAHEFKDTPMIGRTHGVHAEPTTFGLKLANWFSEIQRNRERFERAADEVRVGKISGAVGTFAHLTPDIEKKICQRLSLEPAAVSSQIVQRDRYAYYLATLAVVATSLEKIALEIRHLHRTEVREVEEHFGRGQRGSSAMPHKRNPIVAEQICGLARLVRANAQAALENVPLWHERDISHSSVERVILPDSTILLDYLLDKTAALLEQMRVYPERMRENLELTRGLIYSESLLLALIQKGVAREEAYAWVQEAAAKVWESNQDFKQTVLAHSRIKEKLSAQEIAAACDLRHALRHVDDIFKRVFA